MDKRLCMTLLVLATVGDAVIGYKAGQLVGDLLCRLLAHE